MITINVDGVGKVKLDDSFRDLSPEEQNNTIDEIVTSHEQQQFKKNQFDLVDDWDILRTGLGGVGGAAGAIKGAAAGAALGSAVPLVGTAVGGVAGGILGGIAGGAVGGTAGEAIERYGSGREFGGEDIANVAGEEALWGAAGGVGGALLAKPLARAGRAVIDTVGDLGIGQFILGNAPKRVSNWLKESYDLDFAVRSDVADQALRKFGVETGGATPLEIEKEIAERAALKKEITKLEESVVKAENRGHKEFDSFLNDVKKEHSGKVKELEKSIKASEKKLDKLGSGVRARYDKELKGLVNERKEQIKREYSDRLSTAKQADAARVREYDKAEGLLGKQLADIDARGGGSRFEGAKQHVQKQFDDANPFGRPSADGAQRFVRSERDRAFDDLKSAVGESQRKLNTEVAKVKRQAFQPVKEQRRELQGLLGDQSDQLRRLEGSRAASVSEASAPVRQQLAEKQQQLADLVVDSGVPGSPQQIREIEKQITGMAQKIVDDFVAGKGKHPEIADLPSYFKRANVKGKRGRHSAGALPTQDTLDKVKSEIYDKIYADLIKQGYKDRAPMFAVVAALGRLGFNAADEFSDSEGFAEGGLLKKKIKKVYDEGYTAPGQAYAIAKSYESKGLLGK